MTRQISPDQRKLLYDLLSVLAENVNEKADNDDSRVVTVPVEGSQKENEDNHVDDGEQGTGRERDQPPDVQELERNSKKQIPHEISNIARFKDLVKNHRQLTDHIRSLLNALGGGGRTARALENMQKCISSAAEHIQVTGDTKYGIDPYLCAKGLSNCCEPVQEVYEAFQDLGLFNANFYDALERIKRKGFGRYSFLTRILKPEYGNLGKGPWTLSRISVPVNEYLDTLFEPLTREFETFISIFTSVEKDIAALRQTQEFSSQRFLLLTTIATFLSSVTATTLQITADDAASLLTRTTNTLWLLSLVFSTASAVYSLLVMIWCQSSVVQPDKALPSYLLHWFRSGPMYALIAALTTFSIGLCLLAIRVGDQEGLRASAFVPVAFAGFNTCVIALFSSWFLFVERERPVIRKICRRIKDYSTRVATWLAQNLENTRDRQRREHVAEQVKIYASGRGRVAELAYKLLVHPLGVHEYEPLKKKLLDFSPHSGLLAYVANNVVLICNPQSTSPVLKPLAAPDAEEVEWISWHPDDAALLLIKSSRSVSTWEIYDEQQGGEVRYVKERLGCVSESVASAKWTTLDDDGTEDAAIREGTSWTTLDDDIDIYKTYSFICIVGTTIKLFDARCEEVHDRSIDVSKLLKVDRVVDAAFFEKYLLCLVDVPEDKQFSRMIVLDWEGKAIQSNSTRPVMKGHSSVTVSLESRIVLLHGSVGRDEMAEIAYMRSHPRSGEDELRMFFARLKFHEPGDLMGFYGNDNQILVNYSGSGVALFYPSPGDMFPYPTHLFMTPNAEAWPKKPVYFAVRRGRPSPYMFAFADEDGRVTIWSVQSNSDLDRCHSAKEFEVHDRRDGHSLSSTGKFLVLSPPSTSSADH